MYRVELSKRAEIDMIEIGLEIESDRGTQFANDYLIKIVEQTTVDELERRKPGNKLRANVELYAALILHAVGIPSEIFTPVFAIGRTSGWTAHILEQMPKSLIIRPESIYGGPRNLAFVPMDERA